MTEILIHNEPEALAILQRALNGEFDNDVINIDFDNWPAISFKITGDRYNSSITSSMMKSLLELQVHLNKVYAEILYGSNNSRLLTEEDRRLIEIVYTVEQGSSELFADLSGFFGELAKAAIDKMDAKHLVISIVGVAAIVGAGSGLTSYIAHAETTQREANRATLETALIEQNNRLAAIQQQTALALANVVRSVPDATSVQVNQLHDFNTEDIRELNTTERAKTDPNRIDGPYLVTSVKSRDDKWRVELIGQGEANQYQFTADLPKRLPHSQVTIDALSVGLARGTTVNLSVLGRVRGDIVTVANIIGLHNQMAER